MTRSSQQTYIQRLGFQDKDRSNQRHGLACEYLLEQLIEQCLFANLSEQANEKFSKFVDSIRDRALIYKGDIECKQTLIREYSDTLSQNGEAFSRNWYKKQIETLTGEIEHLTSAFNKADECYCKLLEFCGTIDDAPIKEKIKQCLPSSSQINVPISNGKFVNGFADVLLPTSFHVSLEGVEFAQEKLLLDWCVYLNDNHYQYNSVLGEVKITPEPAENIIQQIAFYRTFMDNVTRVVLLLDYDAPVLKRLTENSDIEVYRLGEKFEQWIGSRIAPKVEEF